MNIEELKKFNSPWFCFSEKDNTFKCLLNNYHTMKELMSIIDYLNEKNIKYIINENEDLIIINS